MSVLPFLETFVAVVNNGSFTGAANALNISKPVVSKQISKLERKLGVMLLHRSTRQLSLTEAGNTFLLYAQNILEKASEAEQSVLPMQANPKGILRITMPESLSTLNFSKILDGFLKLYPKLELDVLVSGQFVDLLESNRDLALRVGKLEDSNLIARRIEPCRFYVCASPEYWQQHPMPQHPNELKNHNCLIYSQSPKADSWFFKDRQQKELYIKVNGNFRSSSGQMILNAALRGQGVFYSPSYLVNKQIEQGLLIPTLEPYVSSISGLYAIYPYSQYVPPKVRLFIDYLIANNDIFK